MTIDRSGVLIVDKAPGITSADVVAMVRRALRYRRVGHAGTLDPDALGVLPILIGDATKLMPYLTEQDKEYLVTARFGVTTDTQDLSGRVLSTSPVSRLDRRDVEAAAACFVGRIRQVPPMYSALHHEGKRLYELARAGIEVAREARDVVVHSFVVDDVTDAGAMLRIVCGKGTYVRVLVADLGAALGCGAAVARLIRTRVGPFLRDDAVPSADIALHGAALWTKVKPPASALAGWPAVSLEAASANAFVHGQSVTPTIDLAAPDAFVAVLDGATLLGIGQMNGAATRVRPVRILHVDRPGTRVLPA